jgi:glyoxylase-like metal-dependent hydrolase (beta-lactamase superfamily II)
MAPSIFQRVAGQSAVVHQPETEAERLRALQAAAACPVGTIRTEQPPPVALSKRARDSFPELIATSGDEHSGTRVYHLGYHSAESYGATSYLVLPAGEAWHHAAFMTDSPRYFRPLADRIEQLLAREGRTLQYLFLTHVDDIADHEKWAERFRIRRIMHADDMQGVGNGSSLASIEITLSGSGPWLMTPDSVTEWPVTATASTATKSGVKILHVPGHTRGCITAIVDGFAAFTGDHIGYSETRKAVSGFPQVCWYDWNLVIESTEKLAAEEFLWIMPGHGRRYHYESVEAMRQGLADSIALMDSDQYWAMVPGGARRRGRQHAGRR